jgi:DNA-directed RNA polymerase specialized sigma24 family protein
MEHDVKPPEPRAGSRERREIHAEDFRRLLARLDADPVLASQAYERLRADLVRFFNRNQNHPEAEELADKALDEVAKKPDSYEIKNIYQFAIGVARYLQIEKSRGSGVNVHIVDDQSIADPEKDPENAVLQRIDRTRRVACFVRCMQTLNAEERWLVLEYYPAESGDLEERRRRLARLLGIGAGALASRMNRLRAKLVKCCGSCYRQGKRSFRERCYLERLGNKE